MEKQIGNAGQAFALGGTWGNPSVDNAMTSEISPVINGTGVTLYTSDIVCLDASGTQAVLAGGAADTTVIGCVGSALSQGSVTGSAPFADNQITMTATAGSMQPFTDSANIIASMGFTNGSPTVTYASAVASDLGKTITTPYNASTNTTPQNLVITAVTVSTGYTVNANFTGTTGSFVVNMGNSPSQLGPGWMPPFNWTSASTFPPGTIVPVIIRGFGRVNINGVAATVKGDLIAVSGANVVGARTAAGATVAAQTGTFIAVTLEAYAARDVSLTGLGIAGHDSVRAIIGKM